MFKVPGAGNEEARMLLLGVQLFIKPVMILLYLTVLFVYSSLDFINLMAYDLHGSWESTIGHHTALYPGDSDVGNNRKLTVVRFLHFLFLLIGRHDNLSLQTHPATSRPDVLFHQALISCSKEACIASEALSV